MFQGGESQTHPLMRNRLSTPLSDPMVYANSGRISIAAVVRAFASQQPIAKATANGPSLRVEELSLAPSAENHEILAHCQGSPGLDDFPFKHGPSVRLHVSRKKSTCQCKLQFLMGGCASSCCLKWSKHARKYAHTHTHARAHTHTQKVTLFPKPVPPSNSAIALLHYYRRNKLSYKLK